MINYLYLFELNELSSIGQNIASDVLNDILLKRATINGFDNLRNIISYEKFLFLKESDFEYFQNVDYIKSFGFKIYTKEIYINSEYFKTITRLDIDEVSLDICSNGIFVEVSKENIVLRDFLDFERYPDLIIKKDITLFVYHKKLIKKESYDVKIRNMYKQQFYDNYISNSSNFVKYFVLKHGFSSEFLTKFNEKSLIFNKIY